jgi:hypothetical protein
VLNAIFSISLPSRPGFEALKQIRTCPATGASRHADCVQLRRTIKGVRGSARRLRSPERCCRSRFKPLEAAKLARSATPRRWHSVRLGSRGHAQFRNRLDLLLSAMFGRQLPVFSLIVPLAGRGAGRLAQN